MRQAVVVLLALSFAAGCSSSYEPARSPRIVTVIDGGYPTFVKDGAHLGGPTFATGLVDAVQGNPRAEQEARTGRTLVVGGFVLSLVGLGSEIGGLAALAQERDSAHGSGLGLGLVLGGAGAAITGAMMVLAGQPHIYDAVNIYNDGLDPPPSTTQPGPRRPVEALPPPPAAP